MLSSPEVLFVYATAPDAATARAIGLAVVDEGLAACANILPGMASIYRWQGRVEEAQECALILKTRREAFDQLAARVRALHPYENPCIVGLPIGAGTSDDLNWIRDSVPTETL